MMAEVGDMDVAVHQGYDDIDDSKEVIRAIELTDDNEIDDRTLILADVGCKALKQVREFVTGLLRRHMDDEQATEVATQLSEGRWTHDFPIDARHVRALGLPVSEELPDEVHLLMHLYLL